MRVEEHIGQVMRQRRETMGLTQEEFGKALEPLLGKSWPRQSVWSAEQGKRALTAVEVVAIANVLMMNPDELFSRVRSAVEVEMPTGVVIRWGRRSSDKGRPLAEEIAREEAVTEALHKIWLLVTNNVQEQGQHLADLLDKRKELEAGASSSESMPQQRRDSRDEPLTAEEIDQLRRIDTRGEPEGGEHGTTEGVQGRRGEACP